MVRSIRVRSIALVASFAALGMFAGVRRSPASEEPSPDAAREMIEREKRLQDVVDDLKSRLAIPDTVAVSIVPVNTLVVSVERSKNGSPGFTLSIEDGFIQRLSDEEVGAVMAHELGHVWIYTHHPFLQTEELANEIAMRVVSRDLLERLYQKVWERTGSKGKLTYLPGK
jgi:predicted Zn-dependent protease